jgi:hypothetical protein
MTLVPLAHFFFSSLTFEEEPLVKPGILDFLASSKFCSTLMAIFVLHLNPEVLYPQGHTLFLLQMLQYNESR